MSTASKLMVSRWFLTLLIGGGAASTAFAQGETATGQVGGQFNGSLYDYTITLYNTSSSVSIGSFWYSWTPNISPYFYLPSTPSSASAPSGWSAGITGNSIEYIAGTGVSLAPEQSIQFHYTATFAPSQLTGDAGYSYIYHGGIESDPGYFLNVQTVPEPSVPGLLAVAGLGLASAWQWKLRRRGTVIG